MFRLVGILSLLLLTYQLVAQAKAVPRITTREEDPSNSRRSLFNIIWGCTSTTIICAWAAVHPNIPPREGPVKSTLRRLELMFWAIVAPEFLPCWALNQLLAAMSVKDVYNKRNGDEMKTGIGETPGTRGMWETVKGWFSMYEIKEPACHVWTRTHGHFLIMGGFHVVEPPEVVPPISFPLVEETNMETGKGPENRPAHVVLGRVTILTLDLLEKLIAEDAEFKIPITEGEITDRSKGDALSKLILILQSTWFILQCVVRRTQGLDLTQLELTTLALASLNGVTFALWWDKPLGAKSAVRVYLKRKLTDAERGQGQISKRSNSIFKIKTIFERCISPFRRQSKQLPVIPLPLAILGLVILPILALPLTVLATVIDLLEPTSFPPDDTYVPTFYVPIHRHSKWYHTSFVIALGVIFGGIHCFGWNFSFPTDPEQKLWRVASLADTIIPIAIPILIAPAFMLRSKYPAIGPFAVMIAMLCMVAYMFARLVLLGLSLSILRDLPPAAFIAINWTKFYPHFL